MSADKFKIAWKCLFDYEISCNLKLLDDGLLVVETGIPLTDSNKQKIHDSLKSEFRTEEYWICDKTIEKGVMSLPIHKK